MWFCEYVPGQARDDTPGCLWLMRHPGRTVCDTADRCGGRLFLVALAVVDDIEVPAE